MSTVFARPQFAAFDASIAHAEISKLIQQANSAVAALCQNKIPPEFAHVADVLESVDDALNCSFSTVQHLHRVAETDALRAAYAPILSEITTYQTALMQNRELFALIDGVNITDLTPVELALRARWLKDFRLGGLYLVGKDADRFREIAQKLSELSTDFEQQLMDATEAWQFHTQALDDLSGLPSDVVTRAASKAQLQGLPGYVLGLDYPSYGAVMSYANHSSLRQRFHHAYATRASDTGPHAKRFDNAVIIERMLALKHEAALLLGFPNIAAQSLFSKMAGHTERVEALLHRLLASASPAAHADIAHLKEFAAATLGILQLQVWDQAYAAEKLKASSLGLDDEMLRPYFSFPRVLAGLFKVIGKLFNVNIRQVDTSVWHDDVQYFEIDRAGQSLAGFYLDAYARPRKRGGAWMDVCRTRRVLDQQIRLPIAYLTCNFAPATTLDDGTMQPALLRHSDVITLFHEFGHGLHLMLTQIDRPGVGGLEGLEWDAVELPSQFMENFCWTDEGLDLLASHWQTGETLPAQLRRQLHASKNFHAGLFLVRQLEFALFDLAIHQCAEPPDIQKVYALWHSVRERTAVLVQPDYHRFPNSFSHIFSGGYSAGYFSYLWAQVLSADAYDAFGESGINAELGQKFAREILAVGSSRPALESFIAFRGREPDVDALLVSYGLN